MPFDRCKSGRSLRGAAHWCGATEESSGENRQGDESAKPEDHGDELGSEDAELVCSVGKVAVREREVRECQQESPDAGKE